jgi:hypothetical protein
MADIEESINSALRYIQMLKAVLKCATTDTLSITQGNPFGFNVIMNELSKKLGEPLNLVTTESSMT